MARLDSLHHRLEELESGLGLVKLAGWDSIQARQRPGPHAHACQALQEFGKGGRII